MIDLNALDIPNVAGRPAFAAIHPDSETAREIVIERLLGALEEAHAGLRRALDYRADTLEGLGIKCDVRDALRRTGAAGVHGAVAA